MSACTRDSQWIQSGTSVTAQERYLQPHSSGLVLQMEKESQRPPNCKGCIASLLMMFSWKSRYDSHSLSCSDVSDLSLQPPNSDHDRKKLRVKASQRFKKQHIVTTNDTSQLMRFAYKHVHIFGMRLQSNRLGKQVHIAVANRH